MQEHLQKLQIIRADALGAARIFTDQQVADFKAKGGTDWQDEILQNSNGQEYQLDYSGGSDRVTYFISGNYLDQDGIVINSYFKRLSLRTNLDAKLTEKLKATLKVNFSRRVNNNTGGALQYFRTSRRCSRMGSDNTSL